MMRYVLIAWSLAACHTNQRFVPFDFSDCVPRIFSIGTTSRLVYEPGESLSIRVEGVNLPAENAKINVQVSGTWPVKPGHVTIRFDDDASADLEECDEVGDNRDVSFPRIGGHLAKLLLQPGCCCFVRTPRGSPVPA